MKIYTKNLFAVITLFVYKISHALPSYASGGDIKSELETKGQLVTDVVTLLAAIIGVVAIAASGIYFSSGNADKGKQFLIGGLIGIFIAGAVYGIASMIG